METPTGSQTHYQLLLEALHVASNNAGLTNCVGARLARGTTDLPNLPHCEVSVIWHWNPKDDTASGYFQYDPNLVVHVQQFIEHKLDDFHFVQFLLVNDKDAFDIARQYSHVQNL